MDGALSLHAHAGAWKREIDCLRIKSILYGKALKGGWIRKGEIITACPVWGRRFFYAGGRYEKDERAGK